MGSAGYQAPVQTPWQGQHQGYSLDSLGNTSLEYGNGEHVRTTHRKPRWPSTFASICRRWPFHCWHSVIIAVTSTCLVIGAILAGVLATRAASSPADVNPFSGKNYYANSKYAGELSQTIAAFLAMNDTLNAARARTVQNIGTFIWISNVTSIPNITLAISGARAEQNKTSQKQVVQLVLYDLPDRDCSAGASSGEFTVSDDGLNKYKHDFIDVCVAAMSNASDITFAVVIEPDALANVITNQDIALCANASSAYEQGVAYAISQLQYPNVALYVDAAHGGWLGWNSTLPLGKSDNI